MRNFYKNIKPSFLLFLKKQLNLVNYSRNLSLKSYNFTKFLSGKVKKDK